ncbi:MAG: hypothetical protein LBU16_04295 [Treponema sp.]|jgi:hypothetical protein|nr:hypothetical protein [Treponema sp.]
MQNLKKILCKALCGAALALLAAGCADILRSPDTPKTGPGKITLTIGCGPPRTVAPGISQFTGIRLTIEGVGDMEDLPDVVVNAATGSATVEFPTAGSWEITAKAYVGGDTPVLAAVSDPHGFSWDGATLSGDSFFILKPAGDGPGILKYTVAVPIGVVLDDDTDDQDGEPASRIMKKRTAQTLTAALTVLSTALMA